MISQIHKIISDYFHLEEQKLFFKSRKKRFVYPRQIFFYFTRAYTNLTLKEISEYSGGFHHSTIISNIKKVNNFIETEKDYKDIIDEIDKEIKDSCKLEIDYNIEREMKKELNFFRKLNKKLADILKRVSIF